MQRALRAGASPADARASDMDYARYCYHHLVVHDLILRPDLLLWPGLPGGHYLCHTSSLFLQRAADSTRVLPLDQQRLLLAANLTTLLPISGPASCQNDLFSLGSRSPGFERLCPGFSLFESESIDCNPAVTGVDALYIVR